jgi:hypothetical protein
MARRMASIDPDQNYAMRSGGVLYMCLFSISISAYARLSWIFWNFAHQSSNARTALVEIARPIVELI